MNQCFVVQIINKISQCTNITTIHIFHAVPRENDSNYSTVDVFILYIYVHTPCTIEVESDFLHKIHTGFHIESNISFKKSFLFCFRKVVICQHLPTNFGARGM